MAEDDRAGYAPPPCFAIEGSPGFFDPLSVMPTRAGDVACWRRAERSRILAARQSQDVIFPQPHDIRLDAIVTEAGGRVVRGPA